MRIVHQGFTEASRKPIAIDNTTMPITSSMIAADRITVPTLPLSLPISFSVSTVMPTLVAARITPINTASSISVLSAASAENPPKKGTASKNPPATGTSTPPNAMSVAFSPERLSSLTSVSKPAENRISTTPISAMPLRKIFSSTPGFTGDHQPNCPQIAGPIKRPATTMPTTCGKPILRISIPRALVANSIIARSSNICVTSMISFFAAAKTHPRAYFMAGENSPRPRLKIIYLSLPIVNGILWGYSAIIINPRGARILHGESRNITRSLPIRRRKAAALREFRAPKRDL